MSRDTTKFFAVRHPLDRLVSAYRDKYQNANKVWYYINFGQEMVRMFRTFPKHLTKAEVRVRLNDILSRPISHLHIKFIPTYLYSLVRNIDIDILENCEHHGLLCLLNF